MKRISAILEHSKFYVALLMMVIMAYAFTHYLDGDIGVVIWSFLILAPLISVLLSYRACRNVTARLDAPAYLAKGKHFSALVVLTAEGKMPVPFLRCQVGQTANFEPDDKRPVQSAMTPQAFLRLPCGMKANYAGRGEIYLQELAVYDYLGWFHFAVKKMPEPVKIGVIPEIPSLTGANTMLHVVTDIVLTQDEEEESAAAFSVQSLPGYVHRDYVAGDNLRRINWKMSAKRQKLMVRMDEAAATVRPTVILDIQPESKPELLKRREVIMEGALGFLMILVRQGVSCTLRFASDQQWKCLVLENEDDVCNAAVALSIADFVNDGNRTDPSAAQEKVGAYMIYTANPDEELSAQAAALKDKGYVCAVYPAGMTDGAYMLAGLHALWTLGEDFSMTSLQK